MQTAHAAGAHCMTHVLTAASTRLACTRRNTATRRVKPKALGNLESQNVLNKLRDYHWLRFSNEKPEIRLGPRFIAEMGPFLKRMFQNKTVDCLHCEKLVIQVRAICSYTYV